MQFPDEEARNSLKRLAALETQTKWAQDENYRLQKLVVGALEARVKELEEGLADVCLGWQPGGYYALTSDQEIIQHAHKLVGYPVGDERAALQPEDYAKQAPYRGSK